MKNNKYSGYVLLLTGLVWIVVFFNTTAWKRDVIAQDITYYYGYLPATFIYHDLNMDFAYKDPYFGPRLWPIEIPGKGRILKMSMGMSMLYCPFFIAGHCYAKLFGYDTRGYSQPYKTALIIGTFFYLVLGLVFLRKLLLLLVPDIIVAITLASIVFGTNLYWYSFFEFLMPHCYLFSLITIFLYLCVRFNDTQKTSIAISIGLLAGLISLIRPTTVVLFLFPLFYWSRHRSRNEIFAFVRNNIIFFSLMFLFCFLAWIPQLAYWKYTTGNWFYYSYGKENFFFNNPHILETLFSFRKGWFIYTPLMLLCIPGFIVLRKYNKNLFLPVVLPFLLGTYAISSWWCWWYGGSFGMRPMIDMYGLLAIPLSSLFQKAFSAFKWHSWIYGIFILLAIYLNLYQTLQYKKGSIHYDSMTKDAYVEGFFTMLNKPISWYTHLYEPDYKRAAAGLPEDITDHEITSHSGRTIKLKSRYQKYVCINNEDENMRAGCTQLADEANERFILSLHDQNFILQAANGKFVTIINDSILSASAKNANEAIKFKLNRINKNIFSISSIHGDRLIYYNPKEPFQLFMHAPTHTIEEEFRLFLE